VPIIARQEEEAMSEANKAVARRWSEEIWNKHNLSAIDELVAADIVVHMGSDPELRGREGLSGFVKSLRTAFPDGHWNNHEQIAERDKVGQGALIAGLSGGELAAWGRGRCVAAAPASRRVPTKESW
jgi:hypothetical protein